jgi:carbon monoxide dehydrogenase subunit G
VELADSFIVDAPPFKVWQVLWDFPRLASSLPGCEEFEQVNPTTFRSRMRQSVGPFRLEIDLQLSVVEAVPEQRIAFTGGGADRQGKRLKIERASVELQPVEGGTRVSYAADFNLSGKLATLGYPMVRRKARDLGAEFGQRLEHIIRSGGSHG